MILGKHTGRHGLAAHMRGLGLDPSAVCLATLLLRVRAVSQRCKRPVEDPELEALYCALAGQTGGK